MLHANNANVTYSVIVANTGTRTAEVIFKDMFDSPALNLIPESVDCFPSDTSEIHVITGNT